MAMTLTLSGCLKVPVASETSAAIMAAWGETLPTASRQDTRQTQLEVGVHRKVYFELCAELECPDE